MPNKFEPIAIGLNFGRLSSLFFLSPLDDDAGKEQLGVEPFRRALAATALPPLCSFLSLPELFTPAAPFGNPTSSRGARASLLSRFSKSFPPNTSNTFAYLPPAGCFPRFSPPPKTFSPAPSRAGFPHFLFRVRFSRGRRLRYFRVDRALP